MGITNVYVNGLALSSKKDKHNVRSTIPDVCLTPPNNIPIPYLNIAKSGTLKKGTKKVRAKGAPCANRKSFYAKSKGDEPGKTGGIISKKTKSKATWLTTSMNVFLEGKPAARHTDKMFMNKMNTVSLAGNTRAYEPSKDVLKAICKPAGKAACKRQSKKDKNGKVVRDENGNKEKLTTFTAGFNQEVSLKSRLRSKIKAPPTPWYPHTKGYVKGEWSDKIERKYQASKNTSEDGKGNFGIVQRNSSSPDAEIDMGDGKTAYVELKYCGDHSTVNQLKSRESMHTAPDSAGYHLVLVCLDCKDCVDPKKRNNCDKYKKSLDDDKNYKTDTDSKNAKEAIKSLKNKIKSIRRRKTMTESQKKTAIDLIEKSISKIPV